MSGLSWQDQNLTPERIEAMDAFIEAMPDDHYDLCPCGCGKKFRFVVREGEEEIRRHEERFIENYIKNKKSH
jgi:hypothetical protein